MDGLIKRIRKYRSLLAVFAIVLMFNSVCTTAFAGEIVAVSKTPSSGAEVVPDTGNEAADTEIVVPVNNGIVPDSAQSPADAAQTVLPVNNAIVPDTGGEKPQINETVPLPNLILKDGDDEASADLNEIVPLNNMVVPEDGRTISDASNPLVNVHLPDDISFIVDPFHMLGGEQIISDTYTFENNSDTNMLVTLESAEYIFANADDFRALSSPFDMNSPSDKKDIFLRFASESLNVLNYRGKVADESSLRTDEASETSKNDSAADQQQGAEMEDADERDAAAEPDLTASDMDTVNSETVTAGDGDTEQITPLPSDQDEAESAEGVQDASGNSVEPDKNEGTASDNKHAGSETTYRDIVSYHHSDDGGLVITDSEVKPLSFVLSSDKNAKDNMAEFKITGSVNPNPEKRWSNSDVRVRLTFTCTPINGMLIEEEAGSAAPETKGFESEVDVRDSEDTEAAVPEQDITDQLPEESDGFDEPEDNTNPDGDSSAGLLPDNDSTDTPEGNQNPDADNTVTGPAMEFTEESTATGPAFDFTEESTVTGPAMDLTEEGTVTGPAMDFTEEDTVTGPAMDFTEEEDNSGVLDQYVLNKENVLGMIQENQDQKVNAWIMAQDGYKPDKEGMLSQEELLLLYQNAQGKKLNQDDVIVILVGEHGITVQYVRDENINKDQLIDQSGDNQPSGPESGENGNDNALTGEHEDTGSNDMGGSTEPIVNHGDGNSGIQTSKDQVGSDSTTTDVTITLNTSAMNQSSASDSADSAMQTVPDGGVSLFDNAVGALFGNGLIQ